ncbi:hypothetical protein HY68_16955, partial [Streptomyces sp. AcH 505]
MESGDRFCGACGYDLTAEPQARGDHPTVALHGAAAQAAPDTPAPGRTAPDRPGADNAVAWPAAAGTDSAAAETPVQHPGELPGLDSAGVQLSTHSGDFVLPAPAEPPAG